LNALFNNKNRPKKSGYEKKCCTYTGSWDGFGGRTSFVIVAVFSAD
jgi:hypothetical protein